MRTVIVNDKNANEVMDMVQHLRDQGLVQGVDFDFAFHQTKWDNMTGEIAKHTIFTFYVEKYATFYGIKWA